MLNKKFKQNATKFAIFFGIQKPTCMDSFCQLFFSFYITFSLINDFWRVTRYTKQHINFFVRAEHFPKPTKPCTTNIAPCRQKKIEIYLPWYFCLTANSKVENAGFLMKFLCQNGNGADQYTRWQKSRLRLQVITRLQM